VPSFVYDIKQDKLITSEEYYFNKYVKVAHLQMMKGNTAVKIYYNSDEMNPTRHMANNKYYTSKKKFRDETRARGCIEVGNDTAPLLKQRRVKKLNTGERRDDVKRAIWELKNGRKV